MLNRLGAFLAGIAVLVMMLIGTADVVGLLVFNHPLPGAYELTESLLVASVFLAIALAQARRQHVRVEIFLNVVPGPVRRALELLGHVMTAGVFAIICYVSWEVALDSIRIGEFSSGLIQFPVWPARTTLAIGTTLMTVQALADIVLTAGLARSPEVDEWSS
ncbi:MAG: TRAP transporter small permease [Hyphomicrobiaceae bacterium]|nr:TRAP transporter small permease [Hyphomicrobiaceae bacterium]